LVRNAPLPRIKVANKPKQFRFRGKWTITAIFFPKMTKKKVLLLSLNSFYLWKLQPLIQLFLNHG
jgi:hypothetical protein